ncbi:MAG: tRNA (adenosine(37)-N6)-threonylcarbamoyltransferase complex ATPase subunit type 1 TsaE [Alphaproteobacteria bacterium]|nr:tRNA (adenosine(37)-N6)-threonylcarbamoyltransferase complex ATPase subunit type 1 TsaE [Alphaproteobacteria bacterium]
MPTNQIAKLVFVDEAATRDFARRFAPCLEAGDVIALAGPLGSGKSVFARAVVRTLGRADEDVPSPTFTLVQTYDVADFTLWHFDLYRLGSAREALEIGLEEAFAGGVSLIEWPERLGVSLPLECLWIELDFDADTDRRTMRLSGPGSWSRRLEPIIADAPA